MSGRRVELVKKGRELKISFPFDERLVSLVRELPRRRFDRDERAWFCPSKSLLEVVDALREHRFVFAKDVLDLYHDQGGNDELHEPAMLFGPGPDVAEDRTRDAPAALTVSELNGRVHQALRAAFPAELWLTGEITGFDRSGHRRHRFFELIEKEESAGGRDQTEVRATVSAVLLENERERIEARLARSGSGIVLKDGIEVRVLVTVELFERRGAYQVKLVDIDPAYTLGRLVQNRDRVLAELARKGLEVQNLSLPWPLLPLRVGLITSVGSDAYNDFVNELERSGFAFRIEVHHSVVQGPELEGQVVRALRYFAARAEQFDLVALVRGGGSRTDLTWFDSLAVAEAVATCPIKVISGIGHHRDSCVVDLIAHCEKTPTAAAGAIVLRVERQAVRLEDLRERLLAVPERLRARRSDLHTAAGSLFRATRSRVRVEVERLRSHRGRLGPRVQGRLRAAGRAAAIAAEQLRARVRGRTRTQLLRQTEFGRRILQATRLLLDRRQGKLETMQRLARSLDPKRVLARGFALVRDQRRRVLRAADQITPGDTLHVTLASGELRARVDEVTSRTHEEGERTLGQEQAD